MTRRRKWKMSTIVLPMEARQGKREHVTWPIARHQRRSSNLTHLTSSPSSFLLVEANVRRSPQKSQPAMRHGKNMEQDLLPEGSNTVFVFGRQVS